MEAWNLENRKDSVTSLTSFPEKKCTIVRLFFLQICQPFLRYWSYKNWMNLEKNHKICCGFEKKLTQIHKFYRKKTPINASTLRKHFSRLQFFLIAPNPVVKIEAKRVFFTIFKHVMPWPKDKPQLFSFLVRKKKLGHYNIVVLSVTQRRTLKNIGCEVKVKCVTTNR